jgi:uncharacterized protein YndB with AHSA1/START domain
MVRREIEMPVTPMELWELLTDPASVSVWMGAAVEWRTEPGAPARFTGGEDGDRDGRIEEVVPGWRLRFQWWPEDHGEDRSEVEYRLEPVDDGVRLVVTERRVAPASAARASAATPAAAAGWSAWDGRLVGIWSVASPSHSGALSLP